MTYIVESVRLGYFCDSKCHVAEQCLAHLGVREATDLIGLVSVSGGGGGGSHRLALCQGPRSCRARNRETQSKDPQFLC